MKQQSFFRTKSYFFLIPLLLLIVTLFSGFFLVRFLEKIGMGHLREQSEDVFEAVSAGIQNELRSAQATAGAMAGSPWILPAFIDPSSANIENANSVLDRYKSAMGFSVCYLLDLQGNAIASSNRNTSDSFVGKNYAFRPFFQEALRGKNFVYMATGITSQERGFYAADPVKDAQGKIAGVAVIKKNVEAAKDMLGRYPNFFYISPDGIVFIAGSKDMVSKTLWPIEDERIREIKDSRQFKEMSFDPVFSHPLRDGERVRFRGEVCQSFRRPLGPPGWSLVLLASFKGVFYFVFLGWTTTAFMAGIVLILTFWSFLHIREQERFRESEERFRGAFESSGIGVALVRPDGRWIQVNPSFCRITGYSEEELLQKKFRDITHPEDIEADLAHARSLLAGEVRDYHMEKRYFHKDGHVLWIYLSRSLVRNAQGAPLYFVSQIKDIAERKQGENYREMGSEILQILNEPGSSQETIQRVLAVLKMRTGVDSVGIRLQDGDDFTYLVQEGFPKDFLLTENTLIKRGADGGVCLDCNGNVSLECSCGLVISGKTDPSNPLFTRAGSFWTNDSFPLLDLPSDQDPRRHPRNQCIHQGYASVALVPIRSKDQIVGLLQFDARRKGCFSLATVEQLESIAAHIGEALMRKRAENDLKKQAQELEAQSWGLQKSNDGIKALYRELETKNLELKKLDRLKDDFVSIVAHELRNPLGVVREAAAFILDGLVGPVSDEQKKYLEVIRRTGDRLIHITTDLLDLAKIEAGKIVVNYEPMDLLSLVRQSCEGILLRANKKGLAVSQDLPDGRLEIFGDFDKLSQVMSNLLNNAFKFTEKGGITVEVRDLGEEVRCAVKDTGPGISEGNLSRLFNKFEQFGNPTVSFEKGSGLGLVISKSIIKAHDGRIWAESESGKGSSFIFTLPKKQRKKKPGEILVEEKTLSPEQLAEALQKQNQQKS